MKKLYLIATFVIILALAVPVIVSADDTTKWIAVKGNVVKAPVIGLNIVSAEGAVWLWNEGPKSYYRTIPDAIEVDIHNDGWDLGYTFSVYEDEASHGKLTPQGTFAQYCVTAPPTYPVGGKTLVNPLKVSSGATEVLVSGSSQALASTSVDGGPFGLDHYFINQTQIIDALDRPVPEFNTYRIVLTFTMTPN